MTNQSPQALSPDSLALSTGHVNVPVVPLALLYNSDNETLQAVVEPRLFVLRRQQHCVRSSWLGSRSTDTTRSKLFLWTAWPCSRVTKTTRREHGLRTTSRFMSTTTATIRIQFRNSIALLYSWISHHDLPPPIFGSLACLENHGNLPLQALSWDRLTLTTKSNKRLALIVSSTRWASLF
jgi:hypothetical protein